jgi:hypothetical protein
LFRHGRSRYRSSAIRIKNDDPPRRINGEVNDIPMRVRRQMLRMIHRLLDSYLRWIGVQQHAPFKAFDELRL